MLRLILLFLLVEPVADGVGGHEGDGEVAGVGEVLLGEEPLQVDHVQRVEGALGEGASTYDACNPPFLVPYVQVIPGFAL